MVMVSSTMMPLGTPAPDFTLPDVVSGHSVTASEFKEARALLVMFICNHCPFVKHVAPELATLGRDYQDKGLAIIAICSNDYHAHPDDAPAKMKEEAKNRGYTFPYVVDADQSVAREYRAACTPDFFLFDGKRRLAYRGQLDDTRPDSGKTPTGADLRRAIDLVLEGKPVPEPHRPSAGCNIKWKAGNEPDYFPKR